MDAVIGQIFIGLSIGSILLLAALGLSLTFGQMGVINMAHGEIMTAGTYTAYVVQQLISNTVVSLIVSLAVGFVVGAALGGILEVVLIRRMYHRPLDTLLVTFGVGLVLQQLFRQIFGAPAVNVVPPDWLVGGIAVFGTTVPKARLFILVLAIAAVGTLIGVLHHTGWGRRIRAVIGDRDLAEASGISSRTTDVATFMRGSALAGIAGVALTLIGPAGPTVGQGYIVDAFLVVVLGGLGHVKGAVLAAGLLGLLESFIEYSTTASTAKVVVFVIVIGLLQIRPQGLLTTTSRSLA
ncbi:urea ABC transporter permease subunit UrtB [Nocardia sp. NPDC052254]|uniref:urea ABC transporter permease subunit UrtB n=1 Tax=Nocardia sp. NPDC052254 TaxID=3155681 RepID=UPI003445A8FD